MTALAPPSADTRPSLQPGDANGQRIADHQAVDAPIALTRSRATAKSVVSTGARSAERRDLFLNDSPLIVEKVSPARTRSRSPRQLYLRYDARSDRAPTTMRWAVPARQLPRRHAGVVRLPGRTPLLFMECAGDAVTPCCSTAISTSSRDESWSESLVLACRLRKGRQALWPRRRRRRYAISPVAPHAAMIRRAGRPEASRLGVAPVG